MRYKANNDSLTWQNEHFTQFCGNEEYSLKIDMNARVYNKELSDDVTFYL